MRDQIALGVHFIKMWVNAVAEPDLKIPPEIRAAIIDEAVQNGAILSPTSTTKPMGAN